MPTIHGQPNGSLGIIWSDLQCANCLSRSIETLSGGFYTAIANDENGCISEDSILIRVFIDRNLYVPNVFSPNGDQVNDQFLITSGSGLKEIEELTIYDRWGNLVFQQSHFQPDDPSASWDGQMRGKRLNPGVYVYKLLVLYKDDRHESLVGDVTIMR
jgi:gliding motility-associated-like protein